MTFATYANIQKAERDGLVIKAYSRQTGEIREAKIENVYCGRGYRINPEYCLTDSQGNNMTLITPIRSK